MSVKGVMANVNLEELTIENVMQGNQQVEKARLRVSWFASFDKQTNKAEYSQCIISTTQKFHIDKLRGLNLPVGRQPNGAPKITLLVPFRNLYYMQKPGNNGQLYLNAYAELDGEVMITTAAPSQKQQGHGGGYNQQPAQYPQQQQQPQFQQPSAGYVPPQQYPPQQQYPQQGQQPPLYNPSQPPTQFQQGPQIPNGGPPGFPPPQQPQMPMQPAQYPQGSPPFAGPTDPYVN